MEKYCLWGPYVAQLLGHGLALTDPQLDIGSADLGWPLGAALAEALSLQSMQAPRGAVALLHIRWRPAHGHWRTQRLGSGGSGSKVSVLGLLLLVCVAVAFLLTLRSCQHRQARVREPLLPVRIPVRS